MMLHSRVAKFITLGVIILIGAFLAVSYFYVSKHGLIFGDCIVQELVSRKASPDGKVHAVVVRMNCGATTNYSYELHLVDSGTKFVVDEPIPKNATKIVGCPVTDWINTNWVDRTRLVVGGTTIRCKWRSESLIRGKTEYSAEVEK